MYVGKLLITYRNTVLQVSGDYDKSDDHFQSQFSLDEAYLIYPDGFTLPVLNISHEHRKEIERIACEEIGTIRGRIA